MSFQSELVPVRERRVNDLRVLRGGVRELVSGIKRVERFRRLLELRRFRRMWVRGWALPVPILRSRSRFLLLHLQRLNRILLLPRLHTGRVEVSDDLI